jgi:hypothetical protein
LASAAIPPRHFCTAHSLFAPPLTTRARASTVVVFRSLAFKFDTLLVACIAVASPCFFFYYRLPGGTIMEFRQSWCVLAVSVRQGPPLQR